MPVNAIKKRKPKKISVIINKLLQEMLNENGMLMVFKLETITCIYVLDYFKN